MAKTIQLVKWKPTQKIEYINNNQALGIKIDWKLVRKEYRKLHCPPSTHNPLLADFDKCGYVIDLSDRSRGKTTNKLLVGLILFKLYGINLHYIRQSSEDCELKAIRKLYETVQDYKYIAKIFDDMFNDIKYIGKRWYLMKRSDNGIEYQCEDDCTYCCGLDESDHMKSTYNAPRGDMIFFDEFISTFYGANDFVRFNDICKTIIRDRLSPVVFLSANTINKNSPWFDEFIIRKEIETMEQGESKIVNSYDTHIYVEILTADNSEVRQAVNKRFWGFPNPKLASITGKGTWATDHYQRIPIYRNPYDEQPRTLQDILYISMSGKLVKLKLVNEPTLGLCVFVTPATIVHANDIVLTADEITNKRTLFGLGKGTFVEAYWKLYDQNKFYYARNSEGDFVRSYLSYYKTKAVKMKG